MLEYDTYGRLQPTANALSEVTTVTLDSLNRPRTLVEANRLSEVPACSNRVKNTTEPRIKTTASNIL